ncbi:MAG: aminotransferase class I/II-fold pyridoxal phosphate-dependent enzyme [Bacteroidota bacterium]
MDLSYIINQLGEERSNYYNAISPPIIKTSNFCFKTVQKLRNNIDREFNVPFYTRGYNPTVAILRKKIAALEYVEDSLITSSGCAAISSAVIANIKADDHVICINSVYSWTNVLFNTLLKKFNVKTTMVEGTYIEDFEKVILPETKLIYLESPSSFTFEIQDIEQIVKLAKKHNILTILDNSYSSPLFQSPIKLGVDIVVHSASKYLNGHSDVIAGVICSNRKMIKKIFSTELMTLGGIITPDDAWLMIRGLRTLPIRMERVTETTQKVIAYMESNPKIEKVIYPFSKTHPQYLLAKKQMQNSGGMFSFILKTNDIAKVDLFCNTLKRFLIACSWGGYESLIYPACVLYNNKKKEKPRLPFNLIRMYIGLEDADVLIKDIETALKVI